MVVLRMPQNPHESAEEILLGGIDSASQGDQGGACRVKADTVCAEPMFSISHASRLFQPLTILEVQ